MAAKAKKFTTLADLKGDPENPRKISAEELQGLGESMSQFGDISGLTFNNRTGELVAGHQRKKKLLQEFGDQPLQRDAAGRLFVRTPPTKKDKAGKTWYIREVDWDRRTQRLASIAANSPELAGEFTGDLQKELRKIEKEDGDLYTALRFEELETDDPELGWGEKPEVEFAEELDEASNYIVLKVSTGTDWAQVQTLLGLKSVNSRRRNGKPWSKGVGRVVKWEDAVKAFRENLHE